jgi:hypothetical protein
VESLSINGSISDNPMEINEHILHFYNKLYSEQCTWRPRVDGLSFQSIDANESTWLKMEFEEQKVWEMVRGLNGDKAPGPDGFTIAFFLEVLGSIENGYYGRVFGIS